MLNNFFIEDHVKKALEEDIGFGDITTDYLTNEEDKMTCELNSRVEGILCGKNVFEMVFKVLSPEVKVTFYKQDGDAICKGDKIADIDSQYSGIIDVKKHSKMYLTNISDLTAEILGDVTSKEVLKAIKRRRD